jgi:hypothetical protein
VAVDVDGRGGKHKRVEIVRVAQRESRAEVLSRVRRETDAEKAAVAAGRAAEAEVGGGRALLCGRSDWDLPRKTSVLVTK